MNAVLLRIVYDQKERYEKLTNCFGMQFYKTGIYLGLN